MNRGSDLLLTRLFAVLLCLAGAASCGDPAVRVDPAARADPTVRAGELRPRASWSWLLRAEQVNAEKLAEASSNGATAIVLALEGGSDDAARREEAAALSVEKAGLEVRYWIEVGRSPDLALAHPEWMASLQGHTEWRRLFKDPPTAGDGEVVKCFPWVPILYQEAFGAHLDRVRKLLDKKPRAKVLFLNDLQAAPSACGCGNILCRWTTDYGPVQTATPAGPDAAARFVAAVKELAPGVEVVPVWTTECEAHDAKSDGACAGVGCYEGLCWKEWMKQFAPLEAVADRLAVLAPFEAFGRDLPLYGSRAGWVSVAVGSLRVQPERHGGKLVDAGRVIAVVQGWNLGAEDVQAQLAKARDAGTAAQVVALFPIDQSWEPRVVKVLKR
jgi:hypothetical protein